MPEIWLGDQLRTGVTAETESECERGVDPGVEYRDVLKIGNIRIVRSRRQAYRGMRKLKLTPADLQLLEFLMVNSGKVFSRRQLVLRLARSDGDLPDERSVDVQIGRIRAILKVGNDPDPIRTVRSFGYSFERGVLTNCTAAGSAPQT